MNHSEIENIIFDLGGVIINLDIDRTFKKFSEIFDKEITTEMFHDHARHAFFRDYELGKMEDDEFRSHIRRLADTSIDDHTIDQAWLAMLMDIPADRAAWIKEATENYNCVVLSNTNHIHVNYFEEFFKEQTSYGYPADIFQKMYYSFEIGERKPDLSSFEYVLNDTGFDPAKTVLFDDLKDNLAAAQKLGMQTVYVERNKLRKEQLPNGRK